MTFASSATGGASGTEIYHHAKGGDSRKKYTHVCIFPLSVDRFGETAHNFFWKNPTVGGCAI